MNKPRQQMLANALGYLINSLQEKYRTMNPRVMTVNIDVLDGGHSSNDVSMTGAQHELQTASSVVNIGKPFLVKLICF